MKMKRKKLILPFVLRMIEQADDLQITEIIQAVIRRYAVIFPDWKIVFLSLPADRTKRELQMEQTIEFLRDYV